MTLREQILYELRQQNEIYQKEIKKLELEISSNALVSSSITGGLLAGAAVNSCENRIETAKAAKSVYTKQNAWINEMLSKYDHNKEK